MNRREFFSGAFGTLGALFLFPVAKPAATPLAIEPSKTDCDYHFKYFRSAQVAPIVAGVIPG